MSNALVKDYVAERDQHLNTISVLEQTTRERGGDPTPQELEAIGKAQKRIDEIDGIVKTLGRDMTMDEETRAKLLAAGRDQTPAAPQYRTAGDMMFDCVQANFGNSHDRDARDARERWDRVMKRAAEHMGTTVAATTATAGGFGGLWVNPTLGPILDLSHKGQPFLTAIGKRPAPNSLTFARPRIVDANLATGVGVQALQKAELASKAFEVKTTNIDLATYGGYLNVSQQLLSLHPEAWNIIISQMQHRVAYAGEAAAIAELNNSTNKITLATGADAATTIAALYNAAVAVWQATDMLPTWIAYGPLGWARLGKLTDTTGRPIFPFIGAQNAIGTGGLDGGGFGMGLQPILTPGITNYDIWVGNEAGFEAYSYPFPVLEAVEPSVFGRQIAVAEGLAFFRPITTETATGNGAVKIGP